MKDTDQLVRLFEMQKKFDQVVQKDILPTIGVMVPTELKKATPHNNDALEWVKSLSYALATECHEVIDLVGWKWWKKNGKVIDLEGFKKELADEIADMWHFLLSLTIQAGLEPADIMSAYEKKWKINFERQNDPKLGYVEENHD